MDRELTRSNALFSTAMLDQLSGETGGLAVRDHPANDVTAEDVKDDVQIIESPFHRPAQFGDVPAPELIGPASQ